MNISERCVIDFEYIPFVINNKMDIGSFDSFSKSYSSIKYFKFYQTYMNKFWLDHNYFSSLMIMKGTIRTDKN